MLVRVLTGGGTDDSQVKGHQVSADGGLCEGGQRSERYLLSEIRPVCRLEALQERCTPLLLLA